MVVREMDTETVKEYQERVTALLSNSSNRNKSLAVLELSADATEEEIKNAWRIHIKAWHPDKFATDKDMQKYAEEKTKDINAAYRSLSSL